MPGSISLAANQVSAAERDGVAVVSFRRTGDLTGAVMITYGITADTALEGFDYTGLAGEVLMPDGAATVSIEIPIINDTLGELTESFVVSLVTVDNGFIIAPRTTRVSILDDELPVEDPVDPPLVSDYDVTLQPVLTGLANPIKAEFSPLDPDLLYVAEKGGAVKVYDISTGAAVSTFMDLSAVVNDVQDRGLMDIAFHPNFAANGYFYAFYVVDPPESAGQFGLAGLNGGGNRYAHVVRYNADPATNYTTVVPGSGVVILGGAGQSLLDIMGAGAIDHTNPINIALPSSETILGPTPTIVVGGYKQDYIKVDSLSHAGGSLSFGPDGNLYVSIGDGTSFDIADPRTVSVQDVNSLSGKILRVDPITGDGLADNPFVQPGMSLDLNAAKVWQTGLRNPFSTGWSPDGRLMISDTGWNSYERIFTGGAGANFGWPWYEGGDNGVLSRTPSYRDFAEANVFYQQVETGAIQVTPAFRGFAHDGALPGFQVQAITAGSAVYTGDRYPIEFQNDYFFTDFSDGEFFTVDVNDRTQLKFLLDAPNGGLGPTDFIQGPDGYVYYVDLVFGAIGRLLISAKPFASDAFQLNGSATAGALDDEYVLTNALAQTGSIMSQVQLDLRDDFQIAARILFGQADSGADGLAFVLHADPAGPAALGDGGWGLGFELLQNGLGIAFDTYTNVERADLATDGGSFINSETLARVGLVDLGNVEDGVFRDVVFTWTAATQTLSYSINGLTLGTLSSPTLIAEYFGGATSVHFGFSASTGGAFNETRVIVDDIQGTVVQPGNAAPVAGDDFVAATVGSVVVLPAAQLLRNDVDADGNPLTIGAVLNPVNGVVALVDGAVRFTPTPGFEGAASFDYEIRDGRGGRDLGKVTITVQPPGPGVYIANGSAFAAGASAFTLTDGLAQTGSIMSTAKVDLRSDFTIAWRQVFGASDAGADGSAFVLHNDPRGASAVGDGGWGLGAELLANGLAVMFDTYTNIERGDLATDYTVIANTATLARLGPLVDLGNIEDGLEHAIVVSWNAATSTFRYSVDGVERGTLSDPALVANLFGGSPFVHFGFTGSTGGAFNIQTIAIDSVAATYQSASNAAPVAVADAYSVTPSAPFQISATKLAANDVDADGDSLTVTAVGNAVNGLVTLALGQVTFTPTPGYTGPAAFEYTVSDGRGASAVGAVALTVAAPAPLGFAPVGAAFAGEAGAFTLTDANWQTGAVNSASRVDFRQSFTITYEHYFGAADTGADGGGFLFHNDPRGASTLGDGGWGLGLDYVDNGLGIAFDTWQNEPRGEPATDSTFFVNTETLARTPFVALPNIEDGLFHTVSIAWNATTSTLTYALDGVTLGSLVSPTIAADYFGGATFAHFAFTGSTGGAFNVQQVRDLVLDVVYEGRARPVAASDALQTLVNTPLTVAASALLANDTDADGDVLAVAAVGNAVNGSVALVAGEIVFTPAVGFSGAGQFDYVVDDGRGARATATVSVSVLGTPQGVADAYTTAEDNTLMEAATRNVLANDVDPDTPRSGLSAALVQQASNGFVTLNPDGTFRYVPNPDFNGTDTFQYRVSDGANVSAATLATITVTPVNDAPVITYNAGLSRSIAIEENRSPVLAQITATDVEGGALSYSLTGADAGDFLVDAGGRVRFAETPNFETPVDGNVNNVYNVSVRVTDAAGAWDSVALAVTVRDVPEAPTPVVNGTPAGETVNGTAASEILVGFAGTDTINAGAGNDIIRATVGDGNDLYRGDAGFDTIDYSAIASSVTVNLATGRGTGASIGTDRYSSIENAIGGSGADILIGNGSANWFTGGAGADTLTGAGGDDRFIFAPGMGADTITDFGDVSGNQDVLDVSAYGFASFEALAATFVQVGANARIDLAPGESVTLIGVSTVNLNPDDFLF